VRTFKGKYKVTVKYPNGSTQSEIVDFTGDKTLTIKALSSSTAEFGFDFNLKISPNPTASTPVTITWNDVLSNDLGRVQVWNSVGVLMLEKPVNMSAGSLVLSDFKPANGLYFVTLTSKMGVQTRKMVVD
jgi:hypothetical protein